MGFPLTPNPGDTYSAESRVWTYDGYGWRFLGASGSVNVTLSGIINYTIGNTAPSGPNSGDKWFHIDDGVEYTFISDFDATSHWIEIGYGCPTIGGGTGINFPNTECAGDLYEYDSRIWVYKGYAWKMVCQNTGDSEFTFGLTAPSAPNPGHRWVDSATGYLYTWIDDGDPIGYTGQWVMFGGGELVGPAGPTGATGIQGLVGPTGPTGEYYFTPRHGISLSSKGNTYTFFVDMLTTSLGITSTLSNSDFLIVQSGNSGSTAQRVTIQNLLSTPIISAPPDVTTTVQNKTFLFYDALDQEQKSATFEIVQQAILSGGVTSINGCTGSIGITGVSGEIEIITSCPTITVGLPNNVTVSGNLFVGGDYGGIIDGGVFV